VVSLPNAYTKIAILNFLKIHVPFAGTEKNTTLPKRKIQNFILEEIISALLAMGNSLIVFASAVTL
jgi:hypothetical protein